MTKQKQPNNNTPDIAVNNINLYDRLAENVVVVLVETSDPGNIGASARAMKTMAISQLRLVRPLHFPHPKASWRSAHALDITEKAQVYTDLAEAVGDCQLIMATSARSRSLPWPLVAVRQTGSIVANAVAAGQSVALVFGCEKTGLTNEELQQCHRHVFIDTSPDYKALNISHAVQLVCYEIFNHITESTLVDERVKDHFGTLWDQPLAKVKDIKALLEALEQTLVDTGFYSPKNPDKLVPRLYRMFMRAGLDQMEVNIWRGIVRHFQSISDSRGTR